MASKESMVTAPIMVLLYDRTFEAGSFRRALRERRGLYGRPGPPLDPLAALVAPGHGRTAPACSLAITPWIYLLNQPRMVLLISAVVLADAARARLRPTTPVSLSSVLPSACVRRRARWPARWPHG